MSGGLERGLKNRHIQLISIGGVIGTGLFLGSGKSISLAGPSILLAYVIVGIIIFLLMRALGELLLSDTSKPSFIDFIEQYLGRGSAFVTGWTYWFCWICLGMTDLTATGMYVRYWAPDIPQWLPEVFALLILAIINICQVKHFGELEFWFALIKVVAIIALIVLGIILLFAALWDPNSGASVTNLFSAETGGFFPTGAGGFLLSFQMVTFAFVGVEVIGVMAGEASNPKVTLPKAINNVPVRVGLFYIGSIFIILCVHPWTTYTPNESPFVNIFSEVGILVAASVINAVVLSSAASACNSSIYSTSRMLYSLSKAKNAFKSATKLTKNGVPVVSVLTSSAVILAAVLLNYFVPEDAFSILTSLSTICFLFVWFIIVLVHYKYRRSLQASGSQEQIALDGNGKPFRMPFFPYANFLIFAFLMFVAIVMLFIFDTLIALICLPFWLIALVIIYRVRTR